MKDKTPEWKPATEAELLRRETDIRLCGIAWRMRGNAGRLAFSVLDPTRRGLVAEILEDAMEYRRIMGEEA